MTYPYYFSWKNNPKREQLYGRKCRVLVRGRKMNICLVEFENGDLEAVYRLALRKVKK